MQRISLNTSSSPPGIKSHINTFSFLYVNTAYPTHSQLLRQPLPMRPMNAPVWCPAQCPEPRVGTRRVCTSWSSVNTRCTARTGWAHSTSWTGAPWDMWPWGSGSSSAWRRRSRWAGAACSRSSVWTRRTRPSLSGPFPTTGCRCPGCSWTPPIRRWSPLTEGRLRTRGRPWRRTAPPPARPRRSRPSCAPPWPRGGSSPCPGRGWGGSSGRRSSPSTAPATGPGGDSHLLQRGRSGGEMEKRETEKRREDEPLSSTYRCVL